MSYTRSGEPIHYWFYGGGVDGISKDPYVTSLIGAAVLDALAKDPDLDSMVVTRVVLTSNDDESCADAWGRGVTLTKAEPAAQKAHDDRGGSDDDDATSSDNDDST